MNLPGRYIRAGESVYSDWFPRRRDSAIFRAQLVEAPDSGSGEVAKIEIYSKSREATGDGAKVGGGSIVFNQGSDDPGDIKNLLIESTASVGLNELVRYRIECKSDWSRVRMLVPVFFDTAKA